MHALACLTRRTSNEPLEKLHERELSVEREILEAIDPKSKTLHNHLLTISFCFKSLSKINRNLEILLVAADTLSAFRFVLPMNLDVKSWFKPQIEWSRLMINRSFGKKFIVSCLRREAFRDRLKMRWRCFFIIFVSFRWQAQDFINNFFK